MTLRLRVAAETDAAAVAAIYRPIVEATAISFEIVPPPPEEMARRMHATLPTHPWLVCELEGSVAGYAYATKHRERAAYRWSVDTSAYVASHARRRGVGKRLYLALLALLAAQGYRTAYAGITLPNRASVAVHESVGFRPLTVYARVGYKLGRWHDVGWWQLVLNEHHEAPEEPLGFRELMKRPQWESLLAVGSGSEAGAPSRIRPGSA